MAPTRHDSYTEPKDIAVLKILGFGKQGRRMECLIFRRLATSILCKDVVPVDTPRIDHETFGRTILEVEPVFDMQSSP